MARAFKGEFKRAGVRADAGGGDELVGKFSQFKVTGLEYNSTKRFRFFTECFTRAFRTNLWRGTVWGVTPEGKCKRLKEVYN